MSSAGPAGGIGEFALIARCFRPLAGPAGLGLADDAAVLTPPAGQDLVLSADAMVAGVHFLPDDPPGLIARKLLRVNLSDLAAKSATPLGYLLTLAAPRATSLAWFDSFAAGLAEDQAIFGISLLGGDTTATDGPLVLSLTILGLVASGMAVRRVGAQAGHGIWVSGTIGDAALGLRARQGRLADPLGSLAERYLLPRPRVGLKLAGIAAACLDVSDGLVQDVGHLCRAGGLGAVIEAALVPLSPAAQAAGEGWRDVTWRQAILAGGDDYELAFALAPEHEAAAQAAARAAGVPITCIGRFVAGEPKVRVMDAAGADITPAIAGWQHF